jgi:hypothetical protein
MKRLSMLMTALALFFMVSVAGAQQANIGFGLGASYPDAPDTAAFDSSVFANYSVNKFFAIGLESGFGWIKKDYSSGDNNPVVENVTLTEAKSINYYTVPLLAAITISIPMGEGESALVPYIKGAAGYSWTTLDGLEENYTFHGFTWQAMLGFNYDLGADANGMKIFLEAGYRGTMVEAQIDRKNYELDMSGPLAHLGVSFPLGGGSDM